MTTPMFDMYESVLMSYKILFKSSVQYTLLVS